MSDNIIADIMADYKDCLFKSVPNEFDDAYQHLVVLCDWSYWMANWASLQDWCQQHGCEVLGMTVNIPDDETMMIFTLRWL